jgi:hypothetical protein
MINKFYFLVVFGLLSHVSFAQEEVSDEAFFTERGQRSNWNTLIAIDDAKYDLKVGGIIIIIGGGYNCDPVGIKKEHHYYFEKYETIRGGCTDVLYDWSIKREAYGRVYNQTILKELYGIQY